MQRRFHWLHSEPLLAVIFWGGVYPGAKLGLREIPVLSFTCLRILVALLMLFIVSGGIRGPARALWPAWLRAGLAQTAFQLLLVAGLRWTTASNSAILLATAPLLSAAWLAASGRATFKSRQWGGLVLGLLGVGAVVRGADPGVTQAHLAGDVLALGAAAAWAWYGLAIGPLVGALGAARATAWTMVIAAGGFVPLAATEMWAYAWGSVSWEAWAGLLYGATLGMVVAMALWGRAMHRFGPKQTMLYVYLEPLSAVGIAALVLGEALHPMQAVGALFTFLGVSLAASR